MLRATKFEYGLDYLHTPVNHSPHGVELYRTRASWHDLAVCFCWCAFESQEMFTIDVVFLKIPSVWACPMIFPSLALDRRRVQPGHSLQRPSSHRGSLRGYWRSHDGHQLRWPYDPLRGSRGRQHAGGQEASNGVMPRLRAPELHSEWPGWPGWPWALVRINPK